MGGIVTDEALRMVGAVESELTMTVYKKEFQRWAAAVDDLNPLYFDESFARAQGHRDVVMPPMFLEHVMKGVTTRSALRNDGIEVGGDSRIAVGAERVHAGMETEWYEWIYPGDILTATRTLASIEEKRGRTGDFAILTWSTTYRRDGVVVARNNDSMIDR